MVTAEPTTVDDIKRETDYALLRLLATIPTITEDEARRELGIDSLPKKKGQDQRRQDRLGVS